MRRPLPSHLLRAATGGVPSAADGTALAPSLCRPAWWRRHSKIAAPGSCPADVTLTRPRPRHRTASKHQPSPVPPLPHRSRPPPTTGKTGPSKARLSTGLWVTVAAGGGGQGGVRGARVGVDRPRRRGSPATHNRIVAGQTLSRRGHRLTLTPTPDPDPGDVRRAAV